MNLYVVKLSNGNIIVLTHLRFVKYLNEGKNLNILSSVYLNLNDLKEQLKELNYELIEIEPTQNEQKINE